MIFSKCLTKSAICIFRCGLRGGYLEVINLDSEVHYQLNKLQSANLGSNVTGQIVMECIVNPPKEGESSYELFQKVELFFSF